MIFKKATVPPEPDAVPVVEPNDVQRIIDLLEAGETALLGQDMQEWAAQNLKGGTHDE